MNFKLFFLSLIIGSVISASIPKLKNHVCPINGPISCQVKEVENTCCTEFPGGQILLTYVNCLLYTQFKLILYFSVNSGIGLVISPYQLTR